MKERKLGSFQTYKECLSRVEKGGTDKRDVLIVGLWDALRHHMAGLEEKSATAAELAFNNDILASRLAKQAQQAA